MRDHCFFRFFYYTLIELNFFFKILSPVLLKCYTVVDYQCQMERKRSNVHCGRNVGKVGESVVERVTSKSAKHLKALLLHLKANN